MLKEVSGLPGAPWNRELNGVFEQMTVESDLLAGNPLGDPARRPLYVYTPPGYDPKSEQLYPTIYVIQGMTGQLDMWTNRVAFEPNMVERVDTLFSNEGTPPAVVVFVDAWTSYGGSQFINSIATGPYMDYLCDEVVAFIDERYASYPDPDRRGICGKSSGGYGSMVVPMLRPDVFRALATHAGDALFETCYAADFPKTVRSLRDHFDGSYDVFWDKWKERERFDFDLWGDALDTYAMAACYSPDPDSLGKALIPFELDTGKLIPEIWEQWLAWDPVRMAPKHAEALRKMKRIYIDAGTRDEYFLDLGAKAFSNELKKLDIDHTLEFFPGTHGGLQYRYPGAIRELVLAIS